MLRTILITLFVLAAPGYAQEGPRGGSSVTLPPVVVEEGYASPPLDYPSAFSTVIELDDFGGEYNTASELLSFSPGVQVRDFGGFGQLKTLSIRGSSNDQVVILLDGIRITSPLGGGVDLSTIPLDYVERLEIVRGGATPLAGTGAIGGVVNIITKKAGTPLTRTSLTFGSFSTLSANITHSGTLGTLGYLFSYTHSQSNGDFDFESINALTVKRINNEFHSESVLLKAEHDLPGGWTLGLLNEFYFDTKGVPGLGEFQEDSSDQRDVRNLTALKLSKRGFMRGDLDFELDLFHRFDMLRFEDPEPTLGVPIDTDSALFTFGAIPRVTWFAPGSHVVSAGSELRAEILSDDGFDDPRRFTMSLFLGDEAPFFGGKLIASPIVRFDLFSTDGDTSSTEAELSPKLGVMYKLHPLLTLKGNAGRSFRAPSFSELFFPEQGFIGGNPELDSETSWDLDIGLALSHPRLGIEVSYFLNRIDDLILFVFVSANRIEPRNIGEVLQQGVETSLVARPVDFLQLFASYTYLNGEVDDTGSQLPGRPENMLDLRAVLNHGPARLYWETHYVDEIPLSALQGSRRTEARTTHDVGLRLGWKGWSLGLEIKNLADNRDVRDAFDFPLPGRQFYLTAGFNLQQHTKETER